MSFKASDVFRLPAKIPRALDELLRAPVGVWPRVRRSHARKGSADVRPALAEPGFFLVPYEGPLVRPGIEFGDVRAQTRRNRTLGQATNRKRWKTDQATETTNLGQPASIDWMGEEKE